MNSSYKKLSKNTLLVFLGKAGSALISLIMLPLYTSWLTPDEYGSVDLINTYSTILLSIISCCIADAIFVIPNRDSKEDVKSFFSTGAIFLVFVSVVSCALGWAMNSLIESDDFVISNCWSILFLTISMMWINFMQQFCRTRNKMNIFSLTGIIQTFSIGFFSFIFIPKYGVNGYVNAFIVANIIGALFSCYGASSYKFFSFSSIKKSKLSDLLKYSIPLMPNSIMWWLVNGFNRPFMESSLGLSAIGLYAVAMKFPSLITSLCDVFMNAFSISMIDEYGKPTFQTFFNTIFKICIVGVILLAIVVSIFSIPIIRIFATEDFFEAWRLLPILTVSSVFTCASGIVGGVFIARKKSMYFFFSSVWGAISSVLLTILFIKYWGLTGCALAVCASFFIMFMVRLYYAWSDIKDGFDVSYLCLHFVILITAIVISLASINIFIKVPVYLLCFGVIYLKNRDLIMVLKDKFLKLIHH